MNYSSPAVNNMKYFDTKNGQEVNLDKLEMANKHLRYDQTSLSNKEEVKENVNATANDNVVNGEFASSHDLEYDQKKRIEEGASSYNTQSFDSNSMHDIKDNSNQTYVYDSDSLKATDNKNHIRVSKNKIKEFYKSSADNKITTVDKDKKSTKNIKTDLSMMKTPLANKYVENNKGNYALSMQEEVPMCQLKVRTISTSTQTVQFSA